MHRIDGNAGEAPSIVDRTVLDREYGVLIQRTSRLEVEVTRDGQRWISDTIVNGKSALRMMVISYLTEEQHIRDLQEALQSAAETISRAS